MTGHWKVIIDKFEYQFRAVICIDVVINLSEVRPVKDTKSKMVAEVFEDGWLSKYSTPHKYIHDNGNEFLGPKFHLKIMIKNVVFPVPITLEDP